MWTCHTYKLFTRDLRKQISVCSPNVFVFLWNQSVIMNHTLTNWCKTYIEFNLKLLHVVFAIQMYTDAAKMYVHAVIRRIQCFLILRRLAYAHRRRHTHAHTQIKVLNRCFLDLLLLLFFFEFVVPSFSLFLLLGFCRQRRLLRSCTANMHALIAALCVYSKFVYVRRCLIVARCFSTTTCST